MSSIDYTSLKIATLKELLNERGLPITGKKSELVERLIESENLLMPGIHHGINSNNTDGDNVDLLLHNNNMIEHNLNEMNADENLQNYGCLIDDDITLDMTQNGDIITNELMIDNILSINSDITNLCDDSSFPFRLANMNSQMRMLNAESLDKDVKQDHFRENYSYENFSCDASNDGSNFDKSGISTLNDDERKLHRRQRFGIKSEADKKLDRAKRFGVMVPELEEEKKRRRALRFGLENSFPGDSSKPTEETEVEKRSKRALRFGTYKEEDKVKMRAKRFGILTEEEKMNQRTEKFKNPPKNRVKV